MNEITQLKQLGLKEAEAKVYLALLQAGPVSIRKVALAANVNRGTTYEALKSLSAIGLAGHNTKGKQKRYFAENPNKIKDLLELKQSQLNELNSSSDRLISKLSSLNVQDISEPHIRFFDDDEGVVTILRDVLSTAKDLPKKEYYVYSSRSMRKYIYRQFPNFTKQRIKQNIRVKVIAVGPGGDKPILAERKWLPEPEDGWLSSYNIIYGNKIAIISLSETNVPRGVLFEEVGVAEMQKYQFEQLWKRLK